MAIRSIMAEFWIDVESDDSGHQAHVYELIVHDQVAGRSIWVYDLRFSAGRCAPSDQAYALAEDQLKGYLAQFGRLEYVVTRQRRSAK
jgi:hypothetical protein